MIESGFRNVISIGWGGMLAPAGTPPEIIQKLQREIARSLASPEVRDRLSAIGADAVGGTTEDFTALLKAETEKWARVVRGANLFHSQ